MLNLPILQSSNLAVYLILLLFQLLFFSEELQKQFFSSRV